MRRFRLEISISPLYFSDVIGINLLIYLSTTFMKKILKQMFRMLGSITIVSMLLSLVWIPTAQATPDTGGTCTAPLDVMLVFDRSDSMTYDSYFPDPVQPLGDAQNGTTAFIDVLNTTNDKVGLVDFYRYAELTHPLSSDFSSVKNAVNDVWVEGWTNIGAGIETAHDELTAHGRDGVKHVIVLLSDGNPNKPKNESNGTAFALEKANEAKADGVVIYTIGWGDNANHELLEDLASSPSNYYYAPTSDGLEDAYMALAETVCVPENTKPVITLAYPTLDLTEGDSFDPFDGHATAHDAEDGDITADLYATSTVDTATPGNYTVEYGVQDSEGLVADAVTLHVRVAESVVETITLVADKIVCEDESYLPNWGGYDVLPIDENTVDTFMSTHGDVCEVVDWDFQWAPQNEVNPSDNSGVAGDPWMTFTGSTQINLSDIAGDDHFWVREVWNDGYIPFTGVNTDLNESAEIYCHIDTVNYDNYDKVDAPFVAGETYYCVAFNVEVAPIYQCSDKADNDGDGLIDAEDIGCWADPQDPQTYDPTDDDETNGTPTDYQCSDGDDNDGDGLRDAEDPGCWATPGDPNTYDPMDDDEFNLFPPVISGGDAPLVLYVGEMGNLDTLARAGVTADDFEDGDITGDIVITGLDTISTTTISTTTIYYDVQDSDGLDAEQKPREVRVVTQCTDGIDNDGDNTIDYNGYIIDDMAFVPDAGCYGPEDNDESDDPQGENTKPVITLAAPSLTINVGGTFDPYAGHATANDAEDGNITADLVATGTVNTATAGNYPIEYNVVDSEGLAADTVTFYVNVGTKTVVTSGGGGGGVYFPQILTISNEKVVYMGNGTAVVTWSTNVPATSKVVYAQTSVPVKGVAPLYGYDAVTVKDNALVTSHSMTVSGLVDGVAYYFRPISDKTNTTEVVGVEVSYNFAPVVVPGTCNYLLEFIQLGADNNPVEVMKLERFLNEFEGENLVVNGVYEQVDFDAVERFQNKYFADILGPWGHDAPTGYVYITTKKKINEIYCQKAFPLSAGEQTEIQAFSAFLASLNAAAAAGEDVTGQTPDFGNTVGLGDDTEDSTLADAGDSENGTDNTLADAGDTADTQGPGLLANILSIFGFGGDDETVTPDDTTLADGEDVATTTDEDKLADAGDEVATGTEDILTDTPERNLAAVIFGGVMSVATSYWFIFLLAVFAVILFLRIRGAEQE
jgi:uncharacterized protein YegL